jgi:hypothetical protein
MSVDALTRRLDIFHSFFCFDESRFGSERLPIGVVANEGVHRG